MKKNAAAFPAFPALAAFGLAALSAPVGAQHFSTVYVDTRLHGRDSVTVAVEGEWQDFMNTVSEYPYYGSGNSPEAYHRYQNKLEAYLQQKVRLSADGKPVYLRAVNWKVDGKGRDDAMDSVTIKRFNHTLVLGGKLPEGVKSLALRSEMWLERPENPRPSIQYVLYQDSTLLRAVWSGNEKTVRFPVTPDSLKAMLRRPPPPLEKRMPTDHSGHQH